MVHIIKRYFDANIYNAEAIKKFVVAKTITEADFKEITGLEYSND